MAHIDEQPGENPESKKIPVLVKLLVVILLVLSVHTLRTNGWRIMGGDHVDMDRHPR